MSDLTRRESVPPSPASSAADSANVEQGLQAVGAASYRELERTIREGGPGALEAFRQLGILEEGGHPPGYPPDHSLLAPDNLITALFSSGVGELEDAAHEIRAMWRANRPLEEIVESPPAQKVLQELYKHIGEEDGIKQGIEAETDPSTEVPSAASDGDSDQADGGDSDNDGTAGGTAADGSAHQTVGEQIDIAVNQSSWPGSAWSPPLASPEVVVPQSSLPPTPRPNDSSAPVPGQQTGAPGVPPTLRSPTPNPGLKGDHFEYDTTGQPLPPVKQGLTDQHPATATAGGSAAPVAGGVAVAVAVSQQGAATHLSRGAQPDLALHGDKAQSQAVADLHHPGDSLDQAANEAQQAGEAHQQALEHAQQVAAAYHQASAQSEYSSQAHQ